MKTRICLNGSEFKKIDFHESSVYIPIGKFLPDKLEIGIEGASIHTNVGEIPKNWDPPELGFDITKSSITILGYFTLNLEKVFALEIEWFGLRDNPLNRIWGAPTNAGTKYEMHSFLKWPPGDSLIAIWATGEVYIEIDDSQLSKSA